MRLLPFQQRIYDAIKSGGKRVVILTARKMGRATLLKKLKDDGLI